MDDIILQHTLTKRDSDKFLGIIDKSVYLILTGNKLFYFSDTVFDNYDIQDNINFQGLKINGKDEGLLCSME